MGARTSAVDEIHELAEVLLAERSPRDHLALLSPRAILMVEIMQLLRGCRPVESRPLFVLGLVYNLTEWFPTGTEQTSAS